jgi:hypothetical protein
MNFNREHPKKERGNTMKDIYLMQKETGEILPSSEVFKEFYKTHGIFDSVFDEWSETELVVDNSTIEFPDFKMAII